MLSLEVERESTGG